jgi:NAD-dependent dihydropyrimidine dehydrogenase PreA subunit
MRALHPGDYQPRRLELALIKEINSEKCNGCGICLDVCPLDVFRIDEGKKAIIKYPDDCMTCFDCDLSCPTGAIYVHPFKEELPLSIVYTKEG